MILLFKVAIIFSVGIFLVPRQAKIYYTLMLQIVLGAVTCIFAWRALTAVSPVIIDLGIPFWGGTPSLIIDRLSAFFILLINFTCILGMIYGSGYLKPYHQKMSGVSMSLHVLAFFLLHASMLHVVMIREGFAFLMAWELMSMSSFVLVIFEGEQDATLKTGINYLVQMHVGFVLLLLAFLWVYAQTGEFSFDALEAYFGTHSNVWLFIVFFIGFGIKAGFVPLHTWLPHAHPAAPSHVSGVMSGIMIKMGIYGIFRTLTMVQNQFTEIGIVVLSIALITGISGILYAIFQKDIKKVLAYSSIENIGIIGIGLGLAILGKGLNNDLFLTMGLLGCLLHILNHNLFKQMLFYMAGNVYFATHTRQLDKLGGLARTIPFTAAIFIVGALAICAIPPFNGFVSEFILYSGVFENISTGNFEIVLISLSTTLFLVAIGGLSVFSFTRTAGLAFLGSRRDTHPHLEKPSPVMYVPALIIIPIMILIGVMPGKFVQFAADIASTFTHLSISTELTANMILVLNNVGTANAMAIIVVGALIAIRFWSQSRVKVAEGPTWGCGYSAGDFRHQYTGTSYSENMREIVSSVVDVSVKKKTIEEVEIFPAHRKFETKSEDLIENRVIKRPVESLLERLSRAGWAQTGRINHYLVYPLAFLIIIGLLSVLGLL